MLSPVTYKLSLPSTWNIHPVFHIDLLTLYRETPLHGKNYQCPPTKLVQGQKEYEVEAVLDKHHYGRKKQRQYLVKWKGYPDSDNEWWITRTCTLQRPSRNTRRLERIKGDSAAALTGQSHQ